LPLTAISPLSAIFPYLYVFRVYFRYLMLGLQTGYEMTMMGFSVVIDIKGEYLLTNKLVWEVTLF